MKRVCLIITAVFLYCCMYGVGWGQERFVVSGMSEKGDTTPSPTMEMAVKDGLTKAVEEAVRGMVTPQTLEERREDLIQGIYSKTELFILSYKISEKIPLPTGYKVLLEVLVDTERIARGLGSLGLLKGGERRPSPRTVELVVTGIKNYQVFISVERLLREIAGVQTFVLSEIEPTTFTWRVELRGEMGALADTFRQQELRGLRGRVVTVTRERVEVELSN